MTKSRTYLVRGAWVILVLSVVMWPVSMLTFASTEPPAVLSLSWFAITLTAAVFIVDSRIHRENDKAEERIMRSLEEILEEVRDSV